MKFSEKLDILLERHNYKRVDFADKVGITYRAFAYYMCDTRKPRKSVLERIARELDVTPDFLIDDSKELKLTQEEKFIRDISSSGKNPYEAAKFLSQSKGLFAGNSLSDKDKDALMSCLKEIYEDSRKGNKK
ncbi:MAG: helix-turn-helix transcriptional regulator [Oscillospiraceae bacterium]|nr:helix-turn-helix transcriptional regulator [Oscillospiraceae bacterium]